MKLHALLIVDVVVELSVVALVWTTLIALIVSMVGASFSALGYVARFAMLTCLTAFAYTATKDAFKRIRALSHAYRP
jgi:uncharacterized membrane protein